MATPEQKHLSLVLELLNSRSAPVPDDLPFCSVDVANEDFEKVYSELTTIRETLKRFAAGNLDESITVRGAVGGYLKTLQANLRHLTWQVEQVAAGDFSQRVDFMGNFSRAFNTMTVRMEQLLKDSKERERLLLLEVLNSCPVCFSILVDGIVRFATPFMKQFLGVELGERLADFFPSTEFGDRLTKGVVNDRSFLWRPITVHTKSGETKEMLVNLFPSDYFDEQGTMVWLIDVTQIRHVEADLRKSRDIAERLARVKGEFIAKMNHEIRTPLNAILGTTHLLRQTELSEKQDLYAETTDQSARLLLRIIDDILDFSELEAGKLTIESKPFSLSQVLEEVMSTVDDAAQKKGLRLSCEASPDLPETVVGDPLHLKQVLSALLDNAVKFTNRGSIVLRVRVDHRDGDDIVLLFSVDDTGIGVSEATLVQLFAPFTQGDNSMSRLYGGTGLGLSLCKSLVELMGGKLWGERREREGTTFHFTVSVAVAPPILSMDDQSAVVDPSHRFPARPIDVKTSETRAGDRRVAIPPNLQGIPILLVEDNKINQLVATELLTLKGFSVDLAVNGRQAVEMVARKNYGLVLMDIQMPEMDGLEATRLIRQKKNFADLPILAMTANATSDDRERCLEVGMNDHIAKPIEPTTLYRNIVRWAKPPRENFKPPTE